MSSWLLVFLALSAPFVTVAIVRTVVEGGQVRPAVLR